MGCLTEPSVELSSRNAPSRWTCYAQQEVEGRPRHVDEQPEGIKLGCWVENPSFIERVQLMWRNQISQMCITLSFS